MGRLNRDQDQLFYAFNLAYRWFCGLGIEDKVPDHSAFSRARNERFRDSDLFREVFERVVEACITAQLVGGEGFAVDASLIEADHDGLIEAFETQLRKLQETKLLLAEKLEHREPCCCDFWEACRTAIKLHASRQQIWAADDAADLDRFLNQDFSTSALVWGIILKELHEPLVVTTFFRDRRKLCLEWCPGAESNHRHRDFQSRALPTELPGREAHSPKQIARRPDL